MRVNADLKRLSQGRNSVPEAHDRSRFAWCERGLGQRRRLSPAHSIGGGRGLGAAGKKV